MERQRTEQVLELMTETEVQSDLQRTGRGTISSGIVRGIISEFDQASGTIHIVLPGLSAMEPIVARSIVPVTPTDIGKEVLVAFEAGDINYPYIIGLLWQPEPPPPSQQPSIEAKVDGEQVVIEGKKEIVLKCGKASITLTRAGKVLIRGAYVLSRSSGVNRIKGGSVQVN